MSSSIERGDPVTAKTIDEVQAAIAVALDRDIDGWSVTRIADHLRVGHVGVVGAASVRVSCTDGRWEATPSVVLLGRDELADAARYVCAARDVLAVVDAALEAECAQIGLTLDTKGA